MNCNIVDGVNMKLRTVSFEDIEKIVEEKFDDAIEENESSHDYYEKEKE